MADQIPASLEKRESHLGGFLSTVLLLALGLGVLLYLFGIVVPPGMFGVRQINFGPGQGFSSEGLIPGFHWRVPFYSDVHLVPQKLQLIDFHREKGDGEYEFPPLEIQTADRATVFVDATILYRFFRAPATEAGHQHGGPRELISAAGVDPKLWMNKVRRTADDALKRTLGQLLTSEFYDPAKRESQVRLALKFMNEGSAEIGIKGLEGQGMRVDEVLLRRYTYSEERIENAIFQKNLQDQEEALNVAERELSGAQALSAEEEARGEARNVTLGIEGEKKVRELRSAADLYEAKKMAEADLLVAKAKAEVDKLRADALTKSRGASVYVARELGPLLSSLRGGVISGLDPYNLDEWMKKLGSKDSVSEKAQ